jgi:hypothetical protein
LIVSILSIFPRMSEIPSPTTLLQELDARQDELLEQLAQLNQRAEALLKQYLDSRATNSAADNGDSPPKLAEAA